MFQEDAAVSGRNNNDAWSQN